MVRRLQPIQIAIQRPQAACRNEVSTASQLYRIPDASLFTGTTPWELLTIVDTGVTGYESNFLAGFLRDPYGNLNIGPYPTIQMFTTISNPPPPWNATPLLAGVYGRHHFLGYLILHLDAGSTLEGAGSILQSNLLRGYDRVDRSKGRLFPAIYPGASLPKPATGRYGPVLRCKSGTTDYFVSLDFRCGGGRILGINGYGYRSQWLASSWYLFTTAPPPPAPTISSARIQAAKAKQADSFWDMSFLRN